MKAENSKNKFYVDFENVSEIGLSGIEKLGSSDSLKIFVSNRARKIDLLLMEKILATGCSFSIERILENKKNSMDFHIVADLGLQMGASSEEGIKHIIISKDKDFNSAVSYFNSKGFEVSTSKNIAEFFSPAETGEPLALAAPKAETEKTEESEFSAICQELKLDGSQAKLVQKLIANSKKLTEFHSGLQKSFKGNSYLPVYKAFKSYYRAEKKK